MSLSESEGSYLLIVALSVVCLCPKLNFAYVSLELMDASVRGIGQLLGEERDSRGIPTNEAFWRQWAVRIVYGHVGCYCLRHH